MNWIKVEDQMPKSGVPVIAFYRNVMKMRRVVRASYAAPGTLPLDEECVDEGGIYDEATDTYYCSEGWYEDNDNEEVHWKISDKVTHWMPLPDPPTEEQGG